MAERTDAARAEVLAAREAFDAEFTRLGPAARAAVDVPAKVRAAPGRSAAVAGGALFLLLGGPGRVYGRLKRAIRGTPSPLPASMLPDEIEAAVRSLGSDGDAVRGALERSFAEYLDKRGSFAQRDARSAVNEAAAGTIRLVARVLGIRLAQRILTGPEPTIRAEVVAEERERFAAALGDVQQRVRRATGREETDQPS